MTTTTPISGGQTHPARDPTDAASIGASTYRPAVERLLENSAIRSVDICRNQFKVEETSPTLGGSVVERHLRSLETQRGRRRPSTRHRRIPSNSTGLARPPVQQHVRSIEQQPQKPSQFFLTLSL